MTRLVALAFIVALCPAASAWEATVYQIPWAGLAAKDCAVMIDRSAVLLRCKGKIDVVVKAIGKGDQ